jgi:hypothetical protein
MRKKMKKYLFKEDFLIHKVKEDGKIDPYPTHFKADEVYELNEMTIKPALILKKAEEFKKAPKKKAPKKKAPENKKIKEGNKEDK